MQFKYTVWTRDYPSAQGKSCVPVFPKKPLMTRCWDKITPRKGRLSLFRKGLKERNRWGWKWKPDSPVDVSLKAPGNVGTGWPLRHKTVLACDSFQVSQVSITGGLCAVRAVC